MNKKLLILSLTTFLMLGLASAQAVQIDDADEFPEELTGGEEFSLGLNYSVDSSEEVPLALDLNVSSEEFSVSEDAFSLSVENGNCDGFRCNLPDSDEDGSVELEVVSDVRLRSGSYSFELGLLSNVAVGEEVDTVNVSEGESETVEGESSSVSIDSQVNGSASVTEVGFVGVNPPSENSRLVGGVEVNVEDDEGNDAGDQASGTVRINFDEDDVEGLDRDSLTVYFYNSSTGEWESLDSTVGDDFVEAEVDHFSVYTVFGDEESSSSGTLDVSDQTVSSVSAGVAEEDEVVFDVEQTVLEVGEETQVTVTAIFEDNSTEDVTSEAVFETEGGVVEVSDEGVITALESGTAQVSASYEAEFGEASDSIEVNVQEEEDTVEELDELELEIEPETVETDEVVELTVLRNGEAVENAEVMVDGEAVGVTGEDGTYTFSTTVPGTYSVAVSDEGDSVESEIVVRSQALTGQFVESASNPWTVVIFLLLVVLGAVFYTGKHREVVERVKELR